MASASVKAFTTQSLNQSWRGVVTFTSPSEASASPSIVQAFDYGMIRLVPGMWANEAKLVFASGDTCMVAVTYSVSAATLTVRFTEVRSLGMTNFPDLGTSHLSSTHRCQLLNCSIFVRQGTRPSDHRVIPGYTALMKTAISLPDETFDRVAQRASDLGMSRSEFFTRAAQRYLDDLDAQSLTGQIDGALRHLHGTDEAEAAAVAVGHRVLDATDDEW